MRVAAPIALVMVVASMISLAVHSVVGALESVVFRYRPATDPARALGDRELTVRLRQRVAASSLSSRLLQTTRRMLRPFEPVTAA